MPGTAVLEAFSRDWIGGDIRGLQGIADRLHSYLPHVQELVARLSKTARNLAADEPDGWSGPAADAFTGAWSRQIATARALEEYVSAAAAAIDSLAVELSQIESALENEAYLVARDGVHIGGNGNVVGYAGLIGLQTAMEYRKVFQQAQAEADQARSAIAEQLNGLYQRVFNPNLNGADVNTGTALLAELMSTPTANRRRPVPEVRKPKKRSIHVSEESTDEARTGAAAGYGAADMTPYLCTEPWGQEIHSHGDTGGVLYGVGRIERSVGDGYEAEYWWDGPTGWC